MKTETIIRSNGSKWLGQEPDTLDQLIAVMAEYPLDPTFEHYGDFAEDGGVAFDSPDQNERWTGYTIFHGNFRGVSHVFNIYTNDPEVIARLRCAIAANKATPAYQRRGPAPLATVSMET